MRIGVDAYFAFHYKTGVAHYIRNLVGSLARYHPRVELVLFTDVATRLHQPGFPNVKVVGLGQEIPYHQWLQHKALRSAILQEELDIFHGTDHGLPSIEGLKTVVTIHDLFFETHPELYLPTDVDYYSAVAPAACRRADRVIAISEFTREQVCDHYNLSAERIRVCYQTCNPLFFEAVDEARKAVLRAAFDLPPRFWLYVGAVIERKNLLQVCRAVNANTGTTDVPLIVIGEGADYLDLVQDYVAQHELGHRIRFLSYTAAARASLSFQQARDVPAFYQMALGLVYPSLLEGFGIPLVEAFASGVPVITSRGSCLPEVGGDAAYYVDPARTDEIATAMTRLETDPALRGRMIAAGRQIVQRYTPERAAQCVMEVYNELL